MLLSLMNYSIEKLEICYLEIKCESFIQTMNKTMFLFPLTKKK